jgi:SAM-dependent methyltransferase
LPVPGDVWNPAQYGKFRDERAAPFHDLLALVRRGGTPRVVDLGCGTGELTRVAHEALAAEPAFAGPLGGHVRASPVLEPVVIVSRAWLNGRRRSA